MPRWYYEWPAARNIDPAPPWRATLIATERPKQALS
jgi:hypothetical protein